MLKNIAGVLIVVPSLFFIFGCSDVEGDVLEAYKCAKAADVFNDRKMMDNAIFKAERIVKDSNIRNTSEFIMSVGQLARDEYEPYGSSTPRKFQLEVLTNWYESSYCEGLKEEDIYGKIVQNSISFREGVEAKNDAIISDNLTILIREERDFFVLNDFLNKNKGNIIKLNVYSCQELEAPCGTIRASEKFLSFNAEHEVCEYNSDIGEGIEISFIGIDDSSYSSKSQMPKNCDFDNKSTLVHQSGVFKVPEDSWWTKGWTEWTLHLVNRN